MIAKNMDKRRKQLRQKWNQTRNQWIARMDRTSLNFYSCALPKLKINIVIKNETKIITLQYYIIFCVFSIKKDSFYYIDGVTGHVVYVVAKRLRKKPKETISAN